MKRFLLFAGENYYPEGGANDLIGAFSSVGDAQAAFDEDDVAAPSGSWAHIYDTFESRITHYCVITRVGGFKIPQKYTFVWKVNP